MENIAINNNEKLHNFMSAVDSQIDERVEKLLSDAQKEKEMILSNAQREAKIAADNHYAEGLKKHGNQYVRDISRATLEMKKEVLAHRESLTDKIFEGVSSQITEFRKTPKYLDYLVKSLIMMNITDDVEIFLAPEDMKLADTLKKALKTDSVQFSTDDKIRLGGLLVYRKAKGTIIDKTFDIALEEQRHSFANSNAFANA